MDLDGSPFVDLPRSAYVTEGALSGRIHPGLATSRVSLPTGAGGREQATNRGRLLAWAISIDRGGEMPPQGSLPISAIHVRLIHRHSCLLASQTAVSTRNLKDEHEKAACAFEKDKLTK